MLEELGAGIDLKRVHFLGKVPYAIFLKILQISTVHVYLTYPFVLSWSMLEAMSAGCVIVGSRTAPVEEVIHDGENGLLVDMFAANDIANRVIDVLSKRQAYAAISQNARRTIVENYDLKTICLPAQLRFLNMVARRMLWVCVKAKALVSMIKIIAVQKGGWTRTAFNRGDESSDTTGIGLWYCKRLLETKQIVLNITFKNNNIKCK